LLSSSSHDAVRRFGADDFRALRDFLAGYLHEDFADEHAPRRLGLRPN